MEVVAYQRGKSEARGRWRDEMSASRAGWKVELPARHCGPRSPSVAMTASSWIRGVATNAATGISAARTMTAMQIRATGLRSGDIACEYRLIDEHPRSHPLQMAHGRREPDSTLSGEHFHDRVRFAGPLLHLHRRVDAR